MRTITRAQAAEAMKNVAKKYPRRKNPIDADSGSCVYTLGSRHCYGGQVCIELDLPLPQEDLGLNRENIGTLADCFFDGVKFEGDALDLLQAAQLEADADRPEWRRVFAKMKREFDL